MKPNIKQGADAAKTGFRAIRAVRTFLKWKGKLPKARRKKKEKLLQKTLRRQQKAEARILRKEKGKRTIKYARGLGRVLTAVERRYF